MKLGHGVCVETGHVGVQQNDCTAPLLDSTTANASLQLATEEVLTALRRHASGDWGDLRPEDALANDTTLEQGGRLFSTWGTTSAQKDRSAYHINETRAIGNDA
jgi:hypothetical protein